MPVVLLVRHGRTAANAQGILAGWTPGIGLDDTGREQAAGTAERLRPVPLAAVVTSPLERTRETAAALLDGHDPAPPLYVDERVGEAHYGDWTGRELKALAKDPLWRVVQSHPSAVTFPGGESMTALAARAVEAVRDWNARLAAEHGDDVVYAVVSHGDVIKAITADAMGLHLDLFQRIVVDPCSVTAVRYTDTRPFLLRCNDVGGGIEAYLPPARPKRRRAPAGRRARGDDAVVGGGAGH